MFLSEDPIDEHPQQSSIEAVKNLFDSIDILIY